MSSAELVTLSEVIEPSFELVRPNFFKRGYWAVLDKLGYETQPSKEEFFLSCFEDSIKQYKETLENFLKTVEAARLNYENIRTSIRDLERRKRDISLQLSTDYSLDMKLLYSDNDQGKPQIRKIAAQDLPAFIRQLRNDLDLIVSYDPNQFQTDFHTTREKYLASGEHVLKDLEDHLLEVENSKVEIEVFDKTLASLRARREQDFENYRQLKTQAIEYEQSVALLVDSTSARINVIRAALHLRSLRINGAVLLSIHNSLKSTEIDAIYEIAQKPDPDVLDQLTQEGSEMTGRVLAITEVGENEP